MDNNNNNNNHTVIPHHHNHSSPQLDLYTIPTQSCWFSWDSIHDTERQELREFFDNSSFTRSVKIYKEYRDFIISKYREDSSRRLTFTDVRKCLVGDVCVLRKVFDFLNKWGLINFSAPPVPPPDTGYDRVRVKVEEGPPYGVRVVMAPGSLKPVLPPIVDVGDHGGGGGVKVGPTLVSYSDVFVKYDGVVCGNCKGKCVTKYYESDKEKYQICLKCYEKGAFGENKVKEDFKIHHSIESSSNQESAWSEAETLLLLESVLKHGDDWELVAQNVQTKTKLECISQLIDLPFGELILGSREKFSSKASIDEGDAGKNQDAKVSTGLNQNVSNATAPGHKTSNAAAQEEKFVANAIQVPQPSPDAGLEHKERQDQQASSDTGPEQKPSDAAQEQKTLNDSRDDTLMEENPVQVIMDDNQKPVVDSHQQEDTKLENGDDIEHLEPPLKKSRIDISDPSRSLMEQVALISTMAGPQITAAAASAAVIALSDGNPLVRDIFYVDDHISNNEKKSGNLDMEMERALTSEDTEMKDASHSSEIEKIFSVRESIPLALQTRAAVGTALGAAAAHARLLADQEEKEIEHLVALVIETQLKKLECKVKLFEDLEVLMQKEHKVLEESKDSIIGQRLEFLRRIVGEGIPRLKDSRPTIS